MVFYYYSLPVPPFPTRNVWRIIIMVNENLAVIFKVKCFENRHLHVKFTFVLPFHLYLSGLEHPMVIRFTVQGCKHKTMSALFTSIKGCWRTIVTICDFCLMHWFHVESKQWLYFVRLVLTTKSFLLGFIEEALGESGQQNVCPRHGWGALSFLTLPLLSLVVHSANA